MTKARLGYFRSDDARLNYLGTPVEPPVCVDGTFPIDVSVPGCTDDGVFAIDPLYPEGVEVLVPAGRRLRPETIRLHPEPSGDVAPYAPCVTAAPLFDPEAF